MPERAEIEAVARGGLQRILDMPCPFGREGDLLAAAQRIASETITRLNDRRAAAEALDRVRDARGDHGPEPDALGGLPPSQPKEDDERRH